MSISSASDSRQPADLIVPLVMCGGAGTRLWPVSREASPKQFIRLMGARSTFQDTVLRLSDASVFDRPIVVTNIAYRFMVLEQLKEIGVEADIVLEPVRRDSAPAIAAGALLARKRHTDALVLAAAADHVITNAGAFLSACVQAAAVAKTGHIVTFGVKPNRPAVEYGYILPGDSLGDNVFKVTKFVEKPDTANASRYLQDGYLWNSGNFLFQAAALLDEYGKRDPVSAKAVSDAVDLAKRDLEFLSLDSAMFASVAAISIDYAVIERTKNAAVVPVSYDWSDVGSWRAVQDLSEKDEQGNTSRGDVFFEGASNCSVMSDGAVVALEGVKDIVVIATGDAILVSAQNDVDGFKRLMGKLKQEVPRVTEDHPKVYRPWGSYQSLDMGVRHQVKRIVVKPGGRLSLQRHFHRSEHWVVVRGTAIVTVNELVKTVHENEFDLYPDRRRASHGKSGKNSA